MPKVGRLTVADLLITHCYCLYAENKKNNKQMSTAEVYMEACKLVGVVPVSYFIRNLDSPTMTLSHHGIGPLGCKALSIALVVSLKCTRGTEWHFETEKEQFNRPFVFILFRLTCVLTLWNWKTITFKQKEQNTWWRCWGLISSFRSWYVILQTDHWRADVSFSSWVWSGEKPDTLFLVGFVQQLFEIYWSWIRG